MCKGVCGSVHRPAHVRIYAAPCLLIVNRPVSFCCHKIRHLSSTHTPKHTHKDVHTAVFNVLEVW